MSEIRLADDDKDRKYRIRINEDGEEELEIIEPEEQTEDDEEYIDFQSDAEEDYERDPEETAELMRAASEEQERLAREEAQDYIEKARSRIEEGDNEYALVALDSAQKAWDEIPEIYTLKLNILTDNFTDFSRADECVALEKEYKKFVPDEEKAQISARYASTIKLQLDEIQGKADGILAENDAKKAERRVKFRANFNKSLRNFLIAFIPFVILLCVACGLSTIMFSDEDGVLFVVTIVMFALAAAGLIASIILLRPFVRDINRLRLNEKNTSTALGRSYIDVSQTAESLREFYDMINFTYESKTETAALAEEDNAAESNI